MALRVVFPLLAISAVLVGATGVSLGLWESTAGAAVTPTLSTTPSPTSVTLGSTSTILKDSATRSGGTSPTGTITFTLFLNGGNTPIDTETVSVAGDGTHTTPTGFTLPTAGTVTGTYQWDATYSGDANNNAASDNNNPNELVTVSAANPVLSTTPNPTAVTLGPTPPTLRESATLSGGASPTGTITFTLFFNGGTTPVDTETVTVTGDATYTTPTGFTLPTAGTVTGTYQWNATYSGDAHNHAISDSGNPGEQVLVATASLAGGARVAAVPHGTGEWIVHPDGGVFGY
jgi:hypothetical protein